MVTFHAGELFKSFTDLQRKLADYSEGSWCHFYIKDSKKLAPDEIVNPHLIYKHIVYNCIYGGQKPRFRGSGNRSVTSIRHGCNASLYLRVTKDRHHLQVRNFAEEHNHEISEELFRSAAQDKKLPEDLKLEVEELLLLGADKDRLIEYIRYVTRKTLDKKNLFNIYDGAVKHQREISRDRAVMLIQKSYAVDTEEEAENILQQLLQSTKPPRRSKKHDVEVMDDVHTIYYNDGDDSQNVLEENYETVDQSLQDLMGTLTGHDGERIVIVQQNDDDQIEVIDSENQIEGQIYEDEDGSQVVIKQEPQHNEGGRGTRYLTVKDIARTFQPRKRSLVDKEESASKTRVLSYPENDSMTSGLNEARLEKIQAEQEKLVAEAEMLKLKRNKLVKDMLKLDAERNKLTLEIELMKQRKKYVDFKSQWMESDLEMKNLKKEKLRLEISKLKFDMNEN